MAKKYLSLERLTEYDELIKGKIDSGDASTLSSAKSYTDTVASGKSDTGHNHDDRYYTETEIDTKLSAVNTSITNITSGTVVVKEAEHATNADTATNATNANHATSADTATSATSATKATQDGDGNVITSTYETKTDASAKLDEAKAYTDTIASGKSDTGHNHDDKYPTTQMVSNMVNNLVGSSVSNMVSSQVASVVSTHNRSTTAHSDIRNLITELTTKVNNFLDVDDATADQLSEVLALIDNNKGTLESITSSKVNVADIVDNLTTSNASKVLSAKQGVAIKELIDALQAEVDGKAASGHGHSISEITNLQTTLDSKATQTSVDTHTGNTTVHITAAERTAWNAAEGNAKAYADTEIDKVESALSTHTGNANIHFSAAERTKLSGIEENATRVIVDSALSATSTNAIQNKAVNSAIVSLTNTIGTNTNSISAHSDRIGALETKVGDGFAEITSAEIQALFNAQ